MAMSGCCCTAVCIDVAKCEPKSCAHEYNYVVNFFYRLNRKQNHIIIFMCTAFWFTVCKVIADSCTRAQRQMQHFI